MSRIARRAPRTECDMNSSEHSSREFLARWQISFDDLVSFVRPMTAGETLLLVGSIPHGLANPLSDVDLVLLGDAGLDQPNVLSETDLEYGTSLVNGHEVHVECWLTRDVEQLGEKLR